MVTLSKNWCEQVWVEYKYLIMLHSYSTYQEIVQAFKVQNQRAKETGNRDWTQFADWLCDKLQECEVDLIDEGNARNALNHAFGHLRGKVSPVENGSWQLLLSADVENAWRVLFLLAMERGDDTLKRSRLFSPTCPTSHVWISYRGKDLFVKRREGNWEVLTREEIADDIADCKVQKLVDYRLMAQLNELTNPLDMYEKQMALLG